MDGSEGNEGDQGFGKVPELALGAMKRFNAPRTAIDGLGLLEWSAAWYTDGKPLCSALELHGSAVPRSAPAHLMPTPAVVLSWP